MLLWSHETFKANKHLFQPQWDEAAAVALKDNPTLSESDLDQICVLAMQTLALAKARGEDLETVINREYSTKAERN
jgi:hypothetical protein